MNRTQLKRRARHAYMDTPRLYMTTFIYLVILLLLTIVSSKIDAIIVAWTNNALRYMEAGNVIPVYSKREWAATLFVFVIQIMIQILTVGYMSFALNISRHRPTGMADLADGFSITFKVFAVYFLQGLFITLWSMLFVVPGIIAAYRYRQAYYILLDDPSKGPLQCIRESKKIMRGHKAELFVLDLSFIGWYILILLSAGILAIWILPYTETTYAIYYNMLLYPDGIFPAPPLYEESNNE
ncbi:MAG: DUF975 family protein [Clostridiales bacterium]|nr:DUF975 family protein [Clostridiales bacterium]